MDTSEQESKSTIVMHGGTERTIIRDYSKSIQCRVCGYLMPSDRMCPKRDNVCVFCCDYCWEDGTCPYAGDKGSLEGTTDSGNHGQVYLVTQGEYSSYQVAAAFSTREKAQEYISSMETATGESGDIEEYELDRPRESWFWTEVCIKRDGTVVEVAQHQSGGKPFITFTKFDGHERDEQHLFWTVRTGDRRRAVKVAAEKAAVLRSMDAWGDNRALAELLRNDME